LSCPKYPLHFLSVAVAINDDDDDALLSANDHHDRDAQKGDCWNTSSIVHNCCLALDLENDTLHYDHSSDTAGDVGINKNNPGMIPRED
jgi:hypothetical protein